MNPLYNADKHDSLAYFSFCIYYAIDITYAKQADGLLLLGDLSQCGFATFLSIA